MAPNIGSHAAGANVSQAAVAAAAVDKILTGAAAAGKPLADAVLLGGQPAVKETGPLLPFDEDFVLLLAIAANCALILAPLRSALRAARNELNPKEMVGLLTPTFLLFGQSYFWAVYGMRTGQPDIWHFNTFGALMCLVYLGFICKGAKEQERIQVHVGAALAASVISSMLISFLLPIPVGARVGLLAITATGFSMLQSAAPMLQALEVVQTQSLQNFPLGVAIFSMLSSLMWAQYAWMARDFMYLVPNGINALVGIAELFVVFRVVHGLAVRMHDSERGFHQELSGLPLPKGLVSKIVSVIPGQKGGIQGLWLIYLSLLFSADSDDFGTAKYSHCNINEPEFEPITLNQEDEFDDAYL